MTTAIKARLPELPSGPGVYLMKDEEGRILYVGKAANLRKRVSSYFSKPSHRDLKTAVLVTKIQNVDTILTHSEKEAFLLESTLIKKHRPHYNVILRDDKRYPCLRLDVKSPYPNLTITRKFRRDGALYFGPFSSAGAVKETLRLVHRTFKLRKCRTKTVKSRQRPCLNYQIGLCLAPCTESISPEAYKSIVDEVVLFLKGRTPDLARHIRNKMNRAAARQDFEAATVYRDQLFALEKTLEKQVVVTADFTDRDVVGVARREEAAEIAVLLVRGGFLQGNRSFHLRKTLARDGEVTAAFIKQYYENTPEIPKEILLPAVPLDRAFLEEWLKEKKGEKVYIRIPQRGEKKQLLNMALRNAEKALQESLAAESRNKALLEQIRKRLVLTACPERIECFDLSHTAGKEPVGGMVVFQDGKPAPAAYRKYRIAESVCHDDYAMLGEVLTRRYAEPDPESPLPDLLIVDGGKGQLNIATKALKDLNRQNAFDVVGIAKKDPLRGETEDKIYKPGRKNPIDLRKAPDVLLFLQRIRDEAHNFVIEYQRKRRMLTYRRSELAEIPGIGKKRQQELLKHFGSLKRIRTASLEELNALPGMSKTAARNVFEAFNRS